MVNNNGGGNVKKSQNFEQYNRDNSISPTLIGPSKSSKPLMQFGGNPSMGNGLKQSIQGAKKRSGFGDSAGDTGGENAAGGVAGFEES